MQYHALSLASMDAITNVTLVGYEGEKVLQALSDSPKITVKHIQQPSFVQFFKSIRIVFAVLKGLGLLVSIISLLLSLPRYELLVIQNPPCLPALIAGIIVSKLRRFRILLDWHNLGFSMYEHSIGPRHPLTRLSRVMERWLGGCAQHHICVSKAMSNWLKTHFAVDAVVFHDRPAQIFSGDRLPAADRHGLLSKLGMLEHHYNRSEADSSETIQTACSPSGEVRVKAGQGRVALLVSSTSWTADEDFDMLFRALLRVEIALNDVVAACALNEFDRLLVVITGKGDLKAGFEAKVAEAKSNGRLGKHVFVQTAWLESAYYPLLLQCADLGVSLHASTSGLDLPMKIVDMFGAGLPVCALDFATLPELVNSDNGLVFNSDQQLSSQILQLVFKIEQQAAARPITNSQLQDLRANLQVMERWNSHWDRVMRPIIAGAICS